MVNLLRIDGVPVKLIWSTNVLIKPELGHQLEVVTEEDLLILSEAAVVKSSYISDTFLFFEQDQYIGSAYMGEENTEELKYHWNEESIDGFVKDIKERWYQPDIDVFKAKAEALLSQLEELVHTMPQKSDTSETSQKTFLINRLNALSRAFADTEQEDLI